MQPRIGHMCAPADGPGGAAAEVRRSASWLVLAVAEGPDELEFAFDGPRRTAEPGRNLVHPEPIHPPQSDRFKLRVVEPCQEIAELLGDLGRERGIRFPTQELCRV